MVQTHRHTILKVLVVDDHALLRTGLLLILQELDKDVEVLEAAECETAFELASLHPDLDLVLLDHQLPNITGLEALDRFGRKHPELPIIIVSGVATQFVMRQAMLKGAAGFIAKSGASEEFLQTLRRVLDGEIVWPEQLADKGLSNASNVGNAAAPGKLTRRQEQVLYLLLQGDSTHSISKKLFLSEETVKTHVSAIIRAFGTKTRLEAILAARRYGYV
jgi:DNA-binding NarL/FixJ family response regulator